MYSIAHNEKPIGREKINLKGIRYLMVFNKDTSWSQIMIQLVATNYLDRLVKITTALNPSKKRPKYYLEATARRDLVGIPTAELWRGLLPRHPSFLFNRPSTP